MKHTGWSLYIFTNIYLENDQRYLYDFFAHIEASVGSVYWIWLFAPDLVVTLFDTVVPSGVS